MAKEILQPTTSLWGLGKGVNPSLEGPDPRIYTARLEDIIGLGQAIA